METATPSFVGRRLQNIDFTASTAMEFDPRADGECAGLVLLQNDRHQFRMVKTLKPAGGLSYQLVIQLICRRSGRDSVLAEQEIQPGRIYLKVETNGQDTNFFFAEQADDWKPLAQNVDGRILSTQIAGGFTGVYLGMYASSNGKESTNLADFDWFEVFGLEG